MSHDINEVIRKYKLNPNSYIASLKDTTTDAEKLMDLLYITHNDQGLINLINKYSMITPLNIMDSDYEPIEK